MSQENNQKPNCPLCEVPKESIATLKQKGSEANSKKEEYDLKKREKEKDFSRQNNVKKMTKAVALILPAVLVVGGISFGLIKQFSGGATGSENTGMPIMEINPKEYDAGAISMAAGLLKHTYEITNKGDGELKINNINTSCHCTTARLKIGDKVSPDFGMESSFSSWSGKIPAGEKGYLEVIFDPIYHGSSGVGDAVRAVYFSTNDPKNKNGEVRLLANVTP